MLMMLLKSTRLFSMKLIFFAFLNFLCLNLLMIWSVRLDLLIMIDSWSFLKASSNNPGMMNSWRAFSLVMASVTSFLSWMIKWLLMKSFFPLEELMSERNYNLSFWWVVKTSFLPSFSMILYFFGKDDFDCRFRASPDYGISPPLKI